MSLNSCDHDGFIVVYENMICPVCTMELEIDELENTIQELEDQND